MVKLADKEEMLMVLDENGKATGKLEKRSIVHNNQLWHNEVALWIINPKTKQVLMQRRSPNKRINPNKLGICAGHVVGHESIVETLKTEAKEEIGLDLNKYEPKYLLTRKRLEKNNYNYSYTYYILADIPLSDFKIQEEELTELVYVDYELLKEISKSLNNETVFYYQNAKNLFDELDKIIL